MPALNTLKAVRERLLGYRFESVVRLSGISADRLRAIEEQEGSPTVFEAEALSDLYGIDSDALVESPIRLAPGDAVEALASLDEFVDVPDAIRARIVGVANAARDLVALRKLQGVTGDPRIRFTREVRQVPNLRRRLPPHREGAHYATEWRKLLRLGSGPITSLRDLVKERFSAVTVLYANLGPDGPAGLSFADQLRGPTMVLNLEGKNANPVVRRFSMAHELCHLVVDWDRRQSLAVLSGYLTDAGLDRERRANAFAVRFLCPQSVIPRLDREAPSRAAEKLSGFGLPYAAVRLYLHNEANVDLPPTPPPEFTGIGTEAAWAFAEEPDGIADFPLGSVPPERRTAVAQAAARAYSSGLIPRDALARYLGVTPDADLERVLDFFALNPPAPSGAAVA
jgi:Zn-dependent peptidase ImmA (M78 family)